MLFNSTVFLVFFAVTYSCYILLRKNVRWQNVLLLIASYIFYGWWDWRFLSLIAVSTVADFFVGWSLGRIDSEQPADTALRKRLLALSVFINLTILGFFKYFNFFVGSMESLLLQFGIELDPLTLNILLPVGISFYTFQTMSYTIDIYRRRLEPTDSLLNFGVFVAFFPQLVAGPIERAVNLLPQIERVRNITPEQVNSGIFLIIWGLFKKVVVADNAGLIANQIFDGYLNYSGIDLLLGVLAFSIQIYGDFSGYSDIARGLSRLMGFELMVNFRLPYFALNPTDFWQRWHISLSSWLRDYLYIPLGGNRGGSRQTYRNLMLTMLLGGLWHGAAWNFVLWGAYHGLILVLYRRFEKQPMHADPWSGQYRLPVVAGKMVAMFLLTLFGWLLFRADSAAQIGYFIAQFSFDVSAQSAELFRTLLSLSWPLIVVQLMQYVSRDLLILTRFRPVVRVLTYSSLVLWSILFGVREAIEFIYFQF